MSLSLTNSDSLFKSFSRYSEIYRSVQANRAETHECRICKCSEFPTRLISPCNCTGTMRWAHEECMQEYRTFGGSCHVCDYTFDLTYKRKTLLVLMGFLNWWHAVSVLFLFPFSYRHDDIQLMFLCCCTSISSFFIQFEIEFSYQHFLKVTNKRSFWELAIDNIISTMAKLNGIALFSLYCSQLNWSFDINRFLPSMASLILCESVAAMLWGLTHMFVPIEEYDEGGVYLIFFLIGLFFWALIRAEAP